MNIVLPFVRQALAQPRRPALVVGSRTIDYGELLAGMAQFAARLRAWGVGPGDRVVMAVAAPAANVTMTLALAAVGAVSVGVVGGMPAEQLEPLVRSLDVHFVVHNRERDFALDHASLKGQLRFEDFLALAALPATPADGAVAAVAPQDIWRIGVSSGTTGAHKGIATSHQAGMLNVQLQLTIFPMTPADRMMIGMGVAMSFSVNYWLRCLYAGACTVLSAEGTAQQVLRGIHEHRVTHLATTPGTAKGMVQMASEPGSAFSDPPASLRMLNVGGGKVSPALYEALRRHVCPVLTVNYGATETNLVAVLDPQTRASHPASAGRLVPWMEAEAVDAQGRTLPAGQTGRLRFRGCHVASGYVGAHEDASGASAFTDGWFQSSDVGSVTPDGVVVLDGRANDVINLNGVKLDPARLEAAIAEDPAVLDCAVVDVPGPLGQPVLVAVIVAPGGADGQALRARCARIGPGLQPSLIVRSKQLPHNAAGKIERDKVRAAAAKALAQQQAH